MGRFDSGAQGLLLLDKPLGWTSHDAVAWVRRRLATPRVGHAGTLDPLATGLLLVCVGAATRLVELLTGHDKQYEALVRFGAVSVTGDAEGPLTPTGVAPPEDLAAAAAVVAGWMPGYDQAPPPHSAKKIAGRPAYELARRGEEVHLPPRRVRMTACEVLPPPPGGRAAGDGATLRLRLDVGSGFYVRSLARDLGAALGCGAYLAGLRRTSVGGFSVARAVAPADLDARGAAGAELAAALRSPDEALGDLPRLAVGPEVAASIDAGRPFRLEWPTALGDPAVPGAPLLLQAGAEFRALGRLEADGGVRVERRLTAVQRAWRGWAERPAAAVPADSPASGG